MSPTTTPELLIRLKKLGGGDSALSCVRADGTATWQRNAGRRGRFFPLHDLTHYAVETILGHRRGFYGLVAEGWNLDDFGHPWPRGRLPVDMDPSEPIVGLLDIERNQGTRLAAFEFREAYSGPGDRPRADLSALTDEDLDRVRALAAELIARWNDLPEGESLELPFDRAGGSRTPARRAGPETSSLSTC